nr:hypothetical protein [uncultured Desulfobulbus sp.]
MFYLPLTTTPVGWLILGLGGYALYQAGKKKGEEEAAAAQITAVPAPVEVHQESAEHKGEK